MNFGFLAATSALLTTICSSTAINNRCQNLSTRNYRMLSLVKMDKQLNFLYDQEADVLYVSLGKPEYTDYTEL